MKASAKLDGRVEEATITPSTEYCRSIRTDAAGSVASLRLTSKGRKPAVLQPAGEQVEDLKDQRVVEVVGDQPDQLGPPRRQAGGQRIRRIAQISSPPASTLARVLAETDAPSVKVRDTAERDTPARSATSFSVTAICCSFAILFPVDAIRFNATITMTRRYKSATRCRPDLAVLAD